MGLQHRLLQGHLYHSSGILKGQSGREVLAERAASLRPDPGPVLLRHLAAVRRRGADLQDVHAPVPRGQKDNPLLPGEKKS